MLRFAKYATCEMYQYPKKLTTSMESILCRQDAGDFHKTRCRHFKLMMSFASRALIGCWNWDVCFSCWLSCCSQRELPSLPPVWTLTLGSKDQWSVGKKQRYVELCIVCPEWPIRLLHPTPPALLPFNTHHQLACNVTPCFGSDWSHDWRVS